MENLSKLEALHLSKIFIQGGQNHQILNSIDQVFIQGKSYAIIGASGSGKSTFLHLLGGLDQPSTGSVLFNGKNINLFSDTEKERFLNRSVGFVFQFHYLINELTAFENVLIKGLLSGRDRAEVEAEANELFEYVGLTAKKNHLPSQLSGGEQQRVAIMRALMNKPAFLLADEPTGNLDAENAEQITRLFVECSKMWGMAVIICSHDEKVCAAMEQRLRLDEGRLRG